MDGVVVAEVHLQGEGGPEFITVDYPVPAQVREAATRGSYELRFVAVEGSIAGGIYGARLLSAMPEKEGEP